MKYHYQIITWPFVPMKNFTIENHNFGNPCERICKIVFAAAWGAAGSLDTWSWSGHGTLSRGLCKHSVYRCNFQNWINTFWSWRYKMKYFVLAFETQPHFFCNEKKSGVSEAVSSQTRNWIQRYLGLLPSLCSNQIKIPQLTPLAIIRNASNGSTSGDSGNCCATNFKATSTILLLSTSMKYRRYFFIFIHSTH